MKRILALILAMAPLFCCACSANPGGVAATTATTTAATTTTPPPAGPPKPDTPELTSATPLSGDGRIKTLSSLTASPTAHEMVELELQIDGITGNVDVNVITGTGKTLEWFLGGE